MIEFIKNIFSNKSKSITVNDFDKILKGGQVNLLDVRTVPEYRKGHIKGARNFPLNTITAYQGDSSKPVYVICHSGLRSWRVANILRKMGYDAINVKGGMMAYQGKLIGGK